MFLKTRSDGSLLEVMDLKFLFDPFSSSVPGKLHAGEELQDLESQMKSDLVFPCLLYTSPSPRDLSTSRMPSSA